MFFLIFLIFFFILLISPSCSHFAKARKKFQQNFTMSDSLKFLAKLIELKVRHMETNQKLWQKYENLLSRIVGPKTAEESETLIKEIAQLEQQMEETELPLSFRTVRLMQPEEYSDEWVCSKNTKGDVLSAFRSFSVVPCKTVMRNSNLCCIDSSGTSRRKVTEIEIHGNFYYVKFEMPRFRELSSTSSLEELFAKLNEIANQNQMSPLFRHPISNFLTGEIMTNYEKIPLFDWHLFEQIDLIYQIRLVDLSGNS
jgi:hypothetical protein